MAFYESLNFILDPVLGPLLGLGPFLALAAISFLISVVITLVYKWVTDQALMKSLKDDINSLQKEMKNHKSNPTKMMEIQKRAMDRNMKYMMHSMKPTLFTFIPLIIIFGWLSSNLAYAPIEPAAKFDVYMFFNDNSSNVSMTVPEGVTLVSSNSEVKTISAGDKLLFNNPYLTKARYGGFLDPKKDIYYSGWKLQADEGTHTLEFMADGKTYFKDVLVSNRKYLSPLEKVNEGNVLGLAVDQKQMIVINLFGWQVAWFWSYVIFSIIFSMALRKALKVY